MSATIKQFGLAVFLVLGTVFVSLAQPAFPNVNIQTINGETVQTKDILNKNQVTIISLWATWCTPCQNELDELNDKDLKGKNIRLIAVSEDDSRTISRVKPLINGKGWDFDIYLDPNNELKRALNVGPIPFLAVVKNNKIVYTKTSYTPGSEDELIKKVLSFK